MNTNSRAAATEYADVLNSMLFCANRNNIGGVHSNRRIADRVGDRGAVIGRRADGTTAWVMGSGCGYHIYVSATPGGLVNPENIRNFTEFRAR